MALTNLGLTTAANEACISLGAGLARILPFAHSLNAEAARRGEIVKVPVYATEAAEFDATSNNYGQSKDVVGVDVAVDKHPVAGFEATDVQLNQSDVNFFADGGRAAARAIARKMNKDFFGMVKGDGSLVGANYTVTPSTKAGWTNLYAVACDDDIDPGNAALVLSPTKYAEVLALVGDAAIVGTDALASGVFKGDSSPSAVPWPSVAVALRLTSRPTSRLARFPMNTRARPSRSCSSPSPRPATPTCRPRTSTV